LDETAAGFVEVLEEALSDVIAFANVEPSPRGVDRIHTRRARRSLMYRAMREYVAVIAFSDHYSRPGICIDVAGADAAAFAL